MLLIDFLISLFHRLPPEERRGYTNVFNALARIAREEGIGTLWRVRTQLALSLGPSKELAKRGMASINKHSDFKVILDT